ncbi:hypothetical protein [Sulfuriflexus sp.]|uniref:hypothetical protein n=1 Tax=Sulfuriflexus sp. TaxID=2015443 RepID=UPI0028CF35B1|nr:hypothetical protein [Sulfuriflexus sp.]MDT8403460.1 hypothetical protein [Sulfuriflexus sp.]
MPRRDETWVSGRPCDLNAWNVGVHAIGLVILFHVHLALHLRLTFLEQAPPGQVVDVA